MIIYLGWFFASVILCLTTLKASRSTQVLLMTFFMMALGIFVGLGDMLGGYDRYIYGEVFDRMADVTSMGGSPWESESFVFFGSEFGYGSLSALITFITGNRYIYIFILTMIIYILLIISICQYTDNAPFAVVVFMGLWFFFTFTYLRQVLGCTVCWLAVRYIYERKLFLFTLVVFIAFSFHNSALIFFPAYFLPIRKYEPKNIMMFMGVALLIGLTPIPQGLFGVYAEINETRVSVESYAEDAGFRWAYLIESLFFLWVILTNYNKISDSRRDVVLLNLALVFCAVLLIFVRSENGGRLGWMFMIAVICTMTKICVQNKQVLQQGGLMIVICLFLYLRVYDAWQNYLNLYPYKTFLTDGYREGDYSWKKYEYDHNYDIDKFYRK